MRRYKPESHSPKIGNRINTWIRNTIFDLKEKTVTIIFFAIAGFFLWVLFQLLYFFYGFSIMAWVQTLPYVYGIVTHIISTITSQTALGIFYLFAFASLFIFPVPLEALYFNLLRQGFSIQTVFIFTVLGIVVGQIANYLLGRLFGFLFVKFIKKKTRRGVRKHLSKYGIAAILAVHIIPFPFQIFNVVCGVFRYPFWKWLVVVIVGVAIKHAIMYGIFLLF